jgi:hypothetical protein
MAAQASSSSASGARSKSRSVFMKDSSTKNFWNRQCEDSRFQWLPTEVAIDKSNVLAKFVSPINNLDTDKYPKVKLALEQVFTALLPGFERVWEYARYLSFDEDNPQFEAQYQDRGRALELQELRLAGSRQDSRLCLQAQ